jgi:hypothetical protein
MAEAALGDLTADQACALRREVADTRPIARPEIPCSVCGGAGWLPLSDAEIVRRTVEEARRIYWTGQAA